MRLTQILVTGAFAAGAALVGSTSAHAQLFPYTPYTQQPGGPSFATYGGANLVIDFAADGSVNTFVPTGATANYDGTEDALVGVINNTSGAIYSLNISSVFGIFGFDGDGIDTFNGNLTSFTINPLNTDTSGYGGPDGYFTNLVFGSTETGTVNFLGGIAPGGSDFFSLEQPIDVSAPPVITAVPEPASLAVLATSLVGLGMIRRRRA